MDDILAPSDDFAPRHLGADPDAVREMLATLGVASLEALVDGVVPADIRSDTDPTLSGIPEAGSGERAASGMPERVRSV